MHSRYYNVRINKCISFRLRWYIMPGQDKILFISMWYTSLPGTGDTPDNDNTLHPATSPSRAASSGAEEEEEVDWVWCRMFAVWWPTSGPTQTTRWRHVLSIWRNAAEWWGVAGDGDGAIVMLWLSSNRRQVSGVVDTLKWIFLSMIHRRMRGIISSRSFSEPGV